MWNYKVWIGVGLAALIALMLFMSNAKAEEDPCPVLARGIGPIETVLEVYEGYMEFTGHEAKHEYFNEKRYVSTFIRLYNERPPVTNHPLTGVLLLYLPNVQVYVGFENNGCIYRGDQVPLRAWQHFDEMVKSTMVKESA